MSVLTVTQPISDAPEALINHSVFHCTDISYLVFYPDNGGQTKRPNFRNTFTIVNGVASHKAAVLKEFTICYCVTQLVTSSAGMQAGCESGRADEFSGRIKYSPKLRCCDSEQQSNGMFQFLYLSALRACFQVGELKFIIFSQPVVFHNLCHWNAVPIPLKPSDYCMYHFFNTKTLYVLPTECIYVFVWIWGQIVIISLYSINL
jgi:hypothetical protein